MPIYNWLPITLQYYWRTGKITNTNVKVAEKCVHIMIFTSKYAYYLAVKGLLKGSLKSYIFVNISP